MMTDIKEQLKSMAETVEGELTECFERPFDAPDIIISAMKYSLFAGGKRLRPILMKETCKMMGGCPDDATKMACAIEMIHTYSLIHDDLPAMDDDELRRGKPTNHMVYGENIAVLAGDALLNFATEIGLEGIAEVPKEKTAAAIKAMTILMTASGVNGMIGGQTGDLLCEEDQEINEEKIRYIHAHKTAALLTAAIVCGATIAQASESDIAALTEYGLDIGMAFQIADDILDVTSSTKVLGKPVGSDVKNHKSTFVSLYGLVSAQEKVREFRDHALAALKTLPVDTQFLTDIANYICNRALD
ncbi:MAG: polyprenyl synthetase family protein [Eubacteriaceae bacterium]|nr:polyprenyl synthetase family protein [Eubacteriaceae bacterium]